MNIRNDLKDYIENVIFKEYEKNEVGHGINHIKYVIRRSLMFARDIDNINLEMVYVIAAYHDIGHHIDYKNHEKVSADILLNDNKLKEFFNEEEINIMSIAVEDHRASNNSIPRNIYGKIVSSADRNTSVDETLRRCYSHNLTHRNNLTLEERLEECRLFLLKKFGISGYARDKIFFKDLEYDKYLDDLTKLASNKEEFDKKIKKIGEFMEYLQVFDEFKNKLDEKIDRELKKTLTGNKYFMIVLLFIENDNKFLLQKTSVKRNSEIATTGGHVSYGDDGYITVIKEAKEELGITLDKQLLKLVDTIKWNNCYMEIYYTNQSVDIDSLMIQEDEVESVNWYSIDEINELINDNKFRKGNIKPFERILEYRKGVT